LKAEPKTVQDFLSGFTAGIQLIKRDSRAAERSLAKWTRENDPYVLTRTVEAHARLFKIPPYVPDKGIENVMKDLVNRRPVPKEFIGHPEFFRDNTPLERSASRS
jgi:hypothetical protein